MTTTFLVSKHKLQVDIFDIFDMFATTTSLTSKSKSEVVFFGDFDVPATSSTSLAFKHELEVVLFGFSMCL